MRVGAVVAWARLTAALSSYAAMSTATATATSFRFIRMAVPWHVARPNSIIGTRAAARCLTGAYDRRRGCIGLCRCATRRKSCRPQHEIHFQPNPQPHGPQC
jgi:hypothetical protein